MVGSSIWSSIQQEACCRLIKGKALLQAGAEERQLCRASQELCCHIFSWQDLSAWAHVLLSRAREAQQGLSAPMSIP